MGSGCYTAISAEENSVTGETDLPCPRARLRLQPVADRGAWSLCLHRCLCARPWGSRPPSFLIEYFVTARR